MSKELRIKKGDVELAIHFDNKDQLKERLSDYEEISKIVEEILGVSFESKKTIRKDLDGICDFADNHVVFINSPDSPLEKICLVIHAYGPSGATLEEISLGSGVTNPSKKYLTNFSYKKYFRKLERGRYGLSDVGISLVTNEILLKLKGGKKDGPN